MPARCAASRQASHKTLGVIGLSGTVNGAGKQIGLWLHPTPVFTQGLEHLRAQWNVAVLAAFALPDADQHAGTIDILHLEVTQFSPAHASRIKRDQHGAME